MKRIALVLALALAGCATQKLAVPAADAYGSLTGISPDDDETSLYDTVDAALVKAGLPRTVRDQAVLAATRARCNAMAASDDGTPPSAIESAQMLHAAGVADADSTYQVLDIPGAYAKHGLSDDDLADAVKKLAGTQGPILAGVCTLANGLANARYYSVTLVNRKAALAALPRSVAEGAEVKVAATASAGVGDLEVYVLDPAGSASTVPATGGTVHASTKGRYVVEVVGKDGGYEKVLARAAFFAGGAAEAFPPKAPEPEKKEGAPEPAKKTAADVVALLGKITSDVRGSPLPADAAAQKLADADAAARAAEKPEVGLDAVEARKKAAGVAGAELLAGQVGLADLATAEEALRSSPFLKMVAKDRALAIAATTITKSGGKVAYALVLGPAPGSSVPPAAPEAPAPAPAPGTTGPGSAAPEHPAPGSAP